MRLPANESRTRRAAVSVLVASLAAPWAAPAQEAPVEYFEGLLWFERRPGGQEARVLPGKLMLHRREQKLAFFSGYTNRFETPFSKVKTLTYEFARKPSVLHNPIPDGQKPFHRATRHLLVLEFQDKGGYFKQEILELPKKSFGEVLKALEFATGLEVKRP
jgi:hypothetical protein